jgi:hypothetical protein
MMRKIFVEGKVITNSQFEECWLRPDFSQEFQAPVDPFVQVLAERGWTPLERSLKILSDKSRIGYLPLEKYDVDVELARTFPAETCRRWCVLPFDRMSKCILVATANPFNRQVALELEEVNKQRILWYLASPAEISKALKKIFR